MTAGYAEVIGDPIAHSLSPAIHGFWLQSLGRTETYRATRVGKAGLPAFLAERRADPAWRGCNVTMPLKLDALEQADQASDRAVTAGAANLLVALDVRLMDANTDVGSVELLLERLAKDGHALETLTLLGSGGAARAALVAFRLLGLTAVTIQARDMAEALKLAVQYGLDSGPVPFDAPIAGAGLINATPLGMAGHPPLDLDLTELAADGWLFDFVTRETPLVADARARGLSVLTGIDMLIEQAAASFLLLFDTDAPRDRDAELRQRLES